MLTGLLAAEEAMSDPAELRALRGMISDLIEINDGASSATRT
jgi:hypothetical protein